MAEVIPTFLAWNFRRGRTLHLFVPPVFFVANVAGALTRSELSHLMLLDAAGALLAIVSRLAADREPDVERVYAMATRGLHHFVLPVCTSVEMYAMWAVHTGGVPPDAHLVMQQMLKLVILCTSAGSSWVGFLTLRNLIVHATLGASTLYLASYFGAGMIRTYVMAHTLSLASSYAQYVADRALYAREVEVATLRRSEAALMAEQSRLLEALRASNERKEYEIQMAKPCAAARAVHGRSPPDGRPPSSLCSNKLGAGAQPADPPLAGYGHLECPSSDSSSPMPSVSRWSRGTAKLGGSPPGGAWPPGSSGTDEASCSEQSACPSSGLSDTPSQAGMGEDGTPPYRDFRKGGIAGGGGGYGFGPLREVASGARAV
mmetsp:Transcript_15124/g.45579  ORF Transcript_15124/g.45579 Transcript_15124/m.45579 type:complete len:374 (-) Transcript_15124:350-1471(-)